MSGRYPPSSDITGWYRRNSFASITINLTQSVKIKLLGIFILALSIALCSGQAPSQKKPLTNADVLQMVKAGLAEGVIVAAIQSNPANYDTSPTALIDLNKQGVSAKVQEAMLAAQKPAQAPPGANAGAATIASLNRVFLLDGTERTEMKQNKGEFDQFAAPFIFKIFIKFEGRNADFRVTNRSPVFEMSLPGNWVAAEHVKLVKPDVQKARRELPVQGVAGPGVPIKPDKKANVALSYEEVRIETAVGVETAVIRVKPVKPLPTGEDVLTVDQTYYCFGVDAAK